MNYNATSGARQPGQKPGGRKKRLVDSAAMGAPLPYNPYTPQMAPGMAPGMAPNMAPGMAPNMYSQPPPYTQEYPQSSQGFSVPGQFLAEPLVANVAMQYGQALMGSGRQLVDKELEKYVPVSRLKYYFAVDTQYVAKKLALLFFPFTHADWSLKYEQDEPVQPRYEINAPDLYIPMMAFVTYVLLAGLVLGMQNRFSPEVLGIQASSALAWTVVEIVVEIVTLYVTNIQTKLRTLDLVAFGGYKYVGIIFAVLLSLVFQRTGYFIGLIYSSVSLAFFLLRTLKVQVLLDTTSSPHDPYRGDSSSAMVGNKRRLYILLFIAGIQPVLMWWLSYHLTTADVVT